jgi:hypothetical protein
MRLISRRLALSFLSIVLAGSVTFAQFQVEVTTDPAEARLDYSDVHNFLTAVDIIAAGHDAVHVMRKYYLDRASGAFRDQIESRQITPDSMAEFVLSAPEIGGKMRQALTELVLREDEIRGALAKLKSIVPDAVFLPNHYMVANQGYWMGEPSGAGVKIVMSQKPFDYSRLPRLVFHENVHVQQAIKVGIQEYQQVYGPKKSLLALALREGVPTFLTRHALGARAGDKRLEYFTANEEALWRKFDQEKLGSETGDWMWVEPSQEGQPRDIGYVLGAAIVESFYENAEDKSAAIQEILGIVDPEAFLEKSRYRDRFVP